MFYILYCSCVCEGHVNIFFSRYDKEYRCGGFGVVFGSQVTTYLVNRNLRFVKTVKSDMIL